MPFSAREQLETSCLFGANHHVLKLRSRAHGSRSMAGGLKSVCLTQGDLKRRSGMGILARDPDAGKVNDRLPCGLGQ
jgi:hypothetical protein